jgi:hypothetical protein
VLPTGGGRFGVVEAFGPGALAYAGFGADAAGGEVEAGDVAALGEVLEGVEGLHVVETIQSPTSDCSSARRPR